MILQHVSLGSERDVWALLTSNDMAATQQTPIFMQFFAFIPQKDMRTINSWNLEVI